MSVGAVVVDDHLLLRILLDDEPPELRPGGEPISTTGLWYHRLCRALTDQTVRGVISKSLGDVDALTAGRAIGAIIELPEAIGLTSLRSLGWAMAELIASGVRLNLLSLEALAAAEQLGAEICLAEADHNRPLIEAAEQRDVSVRFIAR